jgi:hypothetical protein
MQPSDPSAFPENPFAFLNDPPLPVIDVRSLTSFTSVRYQPPAQMPLVHLHFPTLLDGSSSCELPPRNVEFDVIFDPSETTLEEVATLFTSKVSRNTGASRTPWKVRHFVSSSSLFPPSPTLSPHIIRSPYIPPSPLPRLWKPDSMVSSILLPLLLNLPSPISIILDLGSGAGRDVCYLSESLLSSNPSVTVVGIDKHKGSARRSLPLWSKRGVSNNSSHEVRIDRG